MQTLKPFGPSIGLDKLSQSDCDTLMAICNPSLPDANKVLVGLIQEEKSILPALANSDILERIKSIALEYLNNVDSGYYGKLKPLLTSHIDYAGAWYNNQKIYEHQPPHNHIGHSIVIVVFPHVVINTPIPYERNDSNKAGLLTFYHSGNLNDGFGKSTTTIEPKTGDVYVFPADLMHGTLPIYSEEDSRYSISFNLIFSEKARKDLSKIVKKQ
jgi:hypothetical protein